MVFMTEKIPYSLNIGVDLSYYGDLFFNYSIEILPDILTKINQLNLDYFVTNISRRDRKLDINFSSQMEIQSPIFIDDYSLFAYEWKNKHVGRIHDVDMIDFMNNQEKFKADLEYLAHINSKFILIRFDSLVSTGEAFLFNKMVKRFLTENPDKQIHLIIDLTEDGLKSWGKIYSSLGHIDNIGLVLQISSDLPSEGVLSQFIAHNLKSIIIPLSIFVTNKTGYPVLSKPHQDFIKFLFGYKIEVIFSDDCGILIQNQNKNNSSGVEPKYNLSDFSKIKDYSLYICHLFTNHREFKNQDYILYNYLDVFQIPLQPLKDNLQSQTYECFEEDNIKYEYYEKALNKALFNFHDKGFLNLENLKKNNLVKNCTNYVMNDSNPELSERNLTVCVLGGGRGPLVRKVVSAAKNNGFLLGVNFKIICVEKNRNAFNSLLFLKIKEPEIFGTVDFLFQDMRDFKPKNTIDIVVSELLGSFGDNELSPECLLNIQNYLSEDSIMIPYSYTSYLRPVNCPVVWSNVSHKYDEILNFSLIIFRCFIITIFYTSFFHFYLILI
jgi:hypothetical protein